MLTKDQKQQIIQDLKKDISESKAIYFADFNGLGVSDANTLRKILKTQETKAQVVKKTLADIALRESGLNDKSIKEYKGSLLLILAQGDILNAAKSLWQFSRKNDKLKIVGGILDKRFINNEEVISLAKMPAREVLLGRLVGSISSPIRNFIWIWQGNINKLVYALQAIQKNKS